MPPDPEQTKRKASYVIVNDKLSELNIEVRSGGWGGGGGEFWWRRGKGREK